MFLLDRKETVGLKGSKKDLMKQIFWGKSEILVTGL